VLLHQAVQPGQSPAVALAVDRGAIRCPLGLPADGLHARLAEVVSPHGLKPCAAPQSP
jgi:hypothetical protein